MKKLLLILVALVPLLVYSQYNLPCDNLSIQEIKIKYKCSKFDFDKDFNNEFNDTQSSDACYFINIGHKINHKGMCIIPSIMTGLYQVITDYECIGCHYFNVSELEPTFGINITSMYDYFKLSVGSNTYLDAQVNLKWYF